MAVRAGGKVDGVRYASSSFYDPIIPVPTILSTSDDTPANGSSLVLTGENFSASGNSVFLTDGTTPAEQVITAEDTTQITITVDRDVFPYGTSLSLYVVDATALQGPNYPISLTPQAGWAYVNLGVLEEDTDLRITAIADLAPGDQLAYDTVGGKVHVNTDATFYTDDDTVAGFDVEAWTDGEGWGSVATQTISAIVPVDLEFDLALIEIGAPSFVAEAGVEPPIEVMGVEVVPLEFTAEARVEIPVDLIFDVTEVAVEPLESAETAGQELALTTTAIDLMALDAQPEVGSEVGFTQSGITVAAIQFSAVAGTPVDVAFALAQILIESMESTDAAGQRPTFTPSIVRIHKASARPETGNIVPFIRRAIAVNPIPFDPEVRESDPIEAAFRKKYPEFANYDRWPYDMVAQALCEARGEIGKRWGKYKDCSLHQRGLFAFAAHWLVMREAAMKTVAAGSIPSAPGRIGSKSVGDESVSYTYGTLGGGSSTDEVLATTVYGAEFLRLRKRAGMGAVAV